jgi:hypothetical protein
LGALIHIPWRTVATKARDRDTVERWARAEGVDLQNEAERAREKLRTVVRQRE